MASWNNQLPVFCDSVTQNAMNGCIREATAHSHGIAGGAGTDYQGLPQGLQSAPISTPLTPSSSVRPQLPAHHSYIPNFLPNWETRRETYIINVLFLRRDNKLIYQILSFSPFIGKICYAIRVE